MTPFRLQHVDTTLGRLFIRSRICQNSEATLCFWSGLFFDSRMWIDLVASLADRYNLILIDPPGHGQSDMPAEHFRMEHCAKAVAEVLDEFNIPDCVFFGHSWGGFVAQAFLKNYPEMCRGLVLINTCSLPPTRGETILFTILPRLLAWLGPRRLERALANVLLAPESIAGEPQLLPTLRDYLGSLRFSKMRYVFDSVMKMRENLEDSFENARVDCLVLYGAQDAALDRTRTNHLISVVPRTSTVEQVNAGHNIVLEAGSKAIYYIQRYLEAIQ